MRSPALPPLLALAFIFTGITGIACTRGSKAPADQTSSLDGATSIAVAATPGQVLGDAAPVKSAVVDESAVKEDTKTIALKDGTQITIRTVGTALIEVSIPDSAPLGTKKIDIERHLSSTPDTKQHDAILTKSRKRQHTALHGSQYAYRARAAGNEPWSSEVTIQVPEATTVPPMPTAVTATAESPFAVRVSFESSAKGHAGYELQIKGIAAAANKDEWARAALLNPSDRFFLHHYRVPKELLAYRVIAFNALGASDPSTIATVTMTSSPPKGGGAMKPCIPPVLKAPKTIGGCNPDLLIIGEGSAHPITNAPSAGDACRRRLIGEYQSCTREFGAFTLQADIIEVEGISDEGFPLLHAVAGAGAFVGAQLLTFQFSKGRYITVDEAFFCGEPQANPEDPTTSADNVKDLAKCAPPFEVCQSEPSR